MVYLSFGWDTSQPAAPCGTGSGTVDTVGQVEAGWELQECSIGSKGGELLYVTELEYVTGPLE